MISIIACTDRTDSYSRRLANIMAQKLEAAGRTNQLLDLSEIRPAILAEGSYGDSGVEIEKLDKQFIQDADKLLFVVPEYNGSYPGILKYFIDLCQQSSWKGKKACLIGIGAGRGGNLRGVEHLTGVLHYVRCEVMALKLYINQVNDYVNEDGQLTDALTEQLLEEQMQEFLNF